MELAIGSLRPVVRASVLYYGLENMAVALDMWKADFANETAPPKVRVQEFLSTLRSIRTGCQTIHRVYSSLRRPGESESLSGPDAGARKMMDMIKQIDLRLIPSLQQIQNVDLDGQVTAKLTEYILQVAEGLTKSAKQEMSNLRERDPLRSLTEGFSQIEKELTNAREQIDTVKASMPDGETEDHVVPLQGAEVNLDACLTTLRAYARKGRRKSPVGRE